MPRDVSTSTDDAPRITNLISESVSTSHNVAVIIHQRFLVAVPAQIQCDPLARANKIASRLLDATTTTQMQAIAETPTGIGDYLYLIFSVLVAMGFVGCSVVRALERNYHALLWFQLFFVFIIYFLIWSARKLWKPQHVVLIKETGMLYSRRNSFTPPVSIPISTIRFFRKSSSFNPYLTRSRIKYGVEAVTTHTKLSFAHGKSEHVATQLEEILNEYLRSFQGSIPPATMIGNLETSATSICLSKQDIPDVQELPADSNLLFRGKNGFIEFISRHKCVLEAMYVLLSLFAVWIFCLALGLSTKGGNIREVYSSPSVIVGTVLYILTFGILVSLQFNQDSWKICNEQDKRNLLVRFISREKIFNVSDYKYLKLERREARLLVYYVENRKRGKERLSGKRYKLFLEAGDEDTEDENTCILGKLTEGEAMFVVYQMARAFPSLFPKERFEV